MDLSVRVFVAVCLIVYITVRLNLVPDVCLDSSHADPVMMERGFAAGELVDLTLRSDCSVLTIQKVYELASLMSIVSDVSYLRLQEMNLLKSYWGA